MKGDFFIVYGDTSSSFEMLMLCIQVETPHSNGCQGQIMLLPTLQPKASLFVLGLFSFLDVVCFGPCVLLACITLCRNDDFHDFPLLF